MICAKAKKKKTLKIHQKFAFTKIRNTIVKNVQRLHIMKNIFYIKGGYYIILYIIYYNIAKPKSLQILELVGLKH